MLATRKSYLLTLVVFALAALAPFSEADNLLVGKEDRSSSTSSQSSLSTSTSTSRSSTTSTVSSSSTTTRATEHSTSESSRTSSSSSFSFSSSSSSRFLFSFTSSSISSSSFSSLSSKTTASSRTSSHRSTPTTTPAKTTRSGKDRDADATHTTPLTSKWTSPLVTTETRKVVTTILSHHGNHTVSTVVTTSRTVKSTTGFKTGTSTPGLKQDKSDSDDSSLSTSQIKIIAGVIGGVGGAIILGAIFFVYWRLKRKDRDSEEGQGLITPGENSLKVQPDVSYHSPMEPYNSDGRVNAAANF